MGRRLQRKSTISSYHNKGMYHQHDIAVSIDLDHQIEVVFVRFLYGKVTFFPIFQTVLSDRNLLCAAHISGVKSLASSFEANYLHKLFGILLHGDLSLILHLFNHSTIH